jgi:hypothetical protein
MSHQEEEDRFMDWIDDVYVPEWIVFFIGVAIGINLGRWLFG